MVATFFFILLLAYKSLSAKISDLIVSSITSSKLTVHEMDLPSLIVYLLHNSQVNTIPEVSVNLGGEGMAEEQPASW
jgi:hypothetical protein